MAACCEEAEARLSAAHSGDSSARAVDDEGHHALQNGKVPVTADYLNAGPVQASALLFVEIASSASEGTTRSEFRVQW